MSDEDKAPFLLPAVEAEAREREKAEKARRDAAVQRKLANLQPFRPGESGNPNGRQRGGAYVEEWINALLICDDEGQPRYSLDVIEYLANDPESAPALVIAARRILSASRDGTRYEVVTDRRTGERRAYPCGTDPEPGKDFERIMNRLAGKPAQRLEIEDMRETRRVDEIRADLLSLVQSTPGLRALLLTNLLGGDPTREIVADQPAAASLPPAREGRGAP